MTFETFDQSDEETWLVSTYQPTYLPCTSNREHPKRAIIGTCHLWHLRHWLQYWQWRTWIHDNLCFLTINCDTGQHSQFLRCFCTTITQYSYPQIDMHRPTDLFQRSFPSKRNNRYLQRSTPMWALLSQDITCHYDNIYMVCRITYKGLHRILWLFRWKKLWHRGAS